MREWNGALKTMHWLLDVYATEKIISGHKMIIFKKI